MLVDYSALYLHIFAVSAFSPITQTSPSDAAQSLPVTLSLRSQFPMFAFASEPEVCSSLKYALFECRP